MPATFKEVMDFHPQNYDVFNEIKGNISQIMPFVGAGLTARFYGGWKSAIEKLGAYITDPDDQAELERLLQESQYLEAAQFLEDRRGVRNLRRDIANHFSAEKLDARWGEVRHEAIYLLPLLFKRPLLTTNFDQGLERVYQAHGIGLPALNPADDELVEDARRLLREPCVFKLHGTVVGSMTAYESLVFTEKQYSAHYAPGGKARAALSEFARGRAMLFLGCSLQGDRTVDVLREETGTGATNYAIVSCAREECDERIRQLEEAGGIRAILYEDEEYDSVRVVLERLLEETDPDAYARMRLSTPATAP